MTYEYRVVVESGKNPAAVRMWIEMLLADSYPGVVVERVRQPEPSAQVIPDPIVIGCEGSGGSGNRSGADLGCQMCGRWFSDVDTVPLHNRSDVLAMIDRGDFD